jgi:hypothetical protein
MDQGLFKPCPEKKVRILFQGTEFHAPRRYRKEELPIDSGFSYNAYCKRLSAIESFSDYIEVAAFCRSVAEKTQ